MVEIAIKQGILNIRDESGSIFEWNHRAFFNISLGFKIGEDGKSYYFESKTEFQDATREILDYLTEEEIAFGLDSRVSDLVEKSERQAEEFETVRSDSEKDVSVKRSSRFKRKLKSYQKDGLRHLLKVRHGANFSVPGSGKTSVVYAYFDQLKQAGIVDKILVIGPFSSFSPWEEEGEKCFGNRLSAARLVGAKRNAIYLQAERYELFLCHYQTAANDKDEIANLFSENKFLLVVDESHYVKRFYGGVWSEALLAIAPKAIRRVILSGTPMPNGYLDLWSQMTILWPGKQLLGERNRYKTRCDDPVEREEIKKDIRPFFFRVKKSDLELPTPLFSRLYYQLKPIQEQIYHALSARLLSDIQLQPQDRMRLRQWRKAKMVRLIQSASNPTLLSKYSDEFEIPALADDGTSLVDLIEKYSRFEIPAKFESAVALVKELLEKKRKVILWTSFVHNIAMLEKLLAPAELYTIHGAIPKDDSEDEENNREKQIREFKSSENPCVLIANPAACAESISLHKVCHDAIYLDRTFNAGQFIQSLDRIHRIGLEANEIVHYHILIAQNTIDETIDHRLLEKHEAMIHVLEDEIPVGGMDVESHEMEQTESEERLDFEATLKDLRNSLTEKR